MEKKPVLKALVFLLFIAIALFILRLPAVQAFFTEAGIQSFLSRWGVWAPIGYIVFYALAISFMAPGTPITAVGAVLFGTLWGFLFTIIGATLGATSAFWVARTLGHEFAQSLFGERIKVYDKKIEAHGFATIFYLRLVFFPFNALNFGAGLTRVHFKDYLLGTFLGILPGTFIITFFVDSIKDAYVQNGLLSPEFLASLLTVRVLTAVILFGLSFFIPSCIRYAAKKCGREDLVNV